MFYSLFFCASSVCKNISMDKSKSRQHSKKEKTYKNAKKLEGKKGSRKFSRNIKK